MAVAQPHLEVPVRVIEKHKCSLVSTISLDLTYFSDKFVENGFMTSTVVKRALTPHGVGDDEKAQRLLDSVVMNMGIVKDKQK